MKKIISFTLINICCLLTACNTATPEDYFDTAVLNVNMLAGFSGDGLQRELESPSVKLVEGSTTQTEPMKRKEIIDNKIQFIESSLQKVRELKQTDDTKEMLQSSIALYEYVLPVYKNEYTQLAKLYDEDESPEQVEAYVHYIYDRYSRKYDELYNDLISKGKSYAQKNNIKVNWDVHTSPQ